METSHLIELILVIKLYVTKIAVYSSVGSAIRTMLATDGAKHQDQTKYQIENPGYLLTYARVLEMPIAKRAVAW
jgi:hypothetical protein